MTSDSDPVVHHPVRQVMAAIKAAGSPAEIARVVGDYLDALSVRAPPGHQIAETGDSLGPDRTLGLSPVQALVAAVVRCAVADCRQGRREACRWLRGDARAWLALVLGDAALDYATQRLADLADQIERVNNRPRKEQRDEDDRRPDPEGRCRG